jgi:hypothetical protein
VLLLMVWLWPAGCASCFSSFTIETDLHFIREKVTIDKVRVLHVPTMSQFTDIFTKGLLSSLFSEFWFSLNIYSG